MNRDEIADTVKISSLAEGASVVRLIKSGTEIHDFHYSTWEEMASKDKVEEALQGALKYLESQDSEREAVVAGKISELLRRKKHGERILSYLSLTLENRMQFEFWQLENGWIGWRGHDYEYIEQDSALSRMLDEIDAH